MTEEQLRIWLRSGRPAALPGTDTGRSRNEVLSTARFEQKQADGRLQPAVQMAGGSALGGNRSTCEQSGTTVRADE